MTAAALVGTHADAIDLNVETLAQIDLALAKAKYSAALKSVEPRVEVGTD